MSAKNLILTSGNQNLQVTNLLAGNLDRGSLIGLPLGTVGGSTTGEIAVKVIEVGASENLSVTGTSLAVAASTSGSIAAGTKAWAIAFLTGTGTFGGQAVTAPITFSGQNTLKAALTYTTASASTAFVYAEI
jgi:hypothetical protein